MTKTASSGILQIGTGGLQHRGCPTGPKPLETLEERYDGDARLLKFYKKKLLKRGWAGKRNATEREYQRRMRNG